MKLLLLAFVIVSVVKANLYAMNIRSGELALHPRRDPDTTEFIRCGTPSPKGKYKIPKHKRDK